MRARVFLTIAVAALACVLVAGVMRWRDSVREHAPAASVAPEANADVMAGKPQKQWVLMKVVTPMWKEARRSDEFAWNDARVRAWVEQHATVVTVDVATDAETQRALALENAPALLAFKECKEFDRIPLHQSPRGLLEWFAGLERGERSAEMVVGPEPHLDDAALKRAMVEYWASALRWVLAGEYAKATEAYVWLWQRIGIVFYCRPVAFQRDITELVKQSPEARAAFVELREATLKRMGAEKGSRLDVLEFVQLNRVMEDEESTMVWYEGARRERRMMPLIRMAGDEILSVLRREKRWKEACAVMGEPMFEVDRCRQLEDALAVWPKPDENTPRVVETTKSMRSSEMATMYMVLLGAGREKEAREFGEKVREEFRDPKLTLTMVAIAAVGLESPRPEHLRWLEEDAANEDKSGWVRKFVERALMKRLREMTWY